MGWRALSTSLPHRRPASGSEITERIVAYPQPTERERPSQSNGSRQGAAMDYEGFFSDIRTVPHISGRGSYFQGARSTPRPVRLVRHAGHGPWDDTARAVLALSRMN